MFRKISLRKQIRRSKKTIAELEQRRSRSQAALVSAILNNETPQDDDVDYFNLFSERINRERDHLHQVMEEYESLQKK